MMKKTLLSAIISTMFISSAALATCDKTQLLLGTCSIYVNEKPQANTGVAKTWGVNTTNTGSGDAVTQNNGQTNNFGNPVQSNNNQSGANQSINPGQITNDTQTQNAISNNVTNRGNETASESVVNTTAASPFQSNNNQSGANQSTNTGQIANDTQTQNAISNNVTNRGNETTSGSVVDNAAFPFQSAEVNALTDTTQPVALSADMTPEQQQALLDSTLNRLMSEIAAGTNEYDMAQSILMAEHDTTGVVGAAPQMTYAQCVQHYVDYAKLIVEYVQTNVKKNDMDHNLIITDVNGLFSYAWSSILRDIQPSKFPPGETAKKMLGSMSAYVIHFESQPIASKKHKPLAVLMRQFSSNMYVLHDALLFTARNIVDAMQKKKAYAAQLMAYKKQLEDQAAH
jgi:hypothetical protein